MTTPSVLAGTAAVRATLGRLLVLAAAVALLGHGGVELAPRLVAGGVSIAAGAGGPITAGRAATPQPTAQSLPVAPASLRPAPAVPLGTSGADPVAGPGPAPLAAAHQAGSAAVLRPTSSDAGSPVGVTRGRAPPATAGT